MPEPEKIEETPEQEELEKEVLKEGVTEEDIKEKLAEDLDLDPDIDADLLDKLTKKEMAQRKNFSTVVRQKRNWREKAKTPPKDAKETTPKQGDTPDKSKPTLTEEDIDKRVNDRLEARDLEELSLPDELKDEVKKLAKTLGISVKAAAQDPYIKFKKDELEKEKKLLESTPTRKNKGKYTSTYDASKPFNPDDYDLDSKEGRDAYKADQQARRKALSKS